MEEIIGELISGLLEFLIKSNKVPKAIRYILVTIIFGIIVIIGICIGVSSEYAIGKVIAFLISALILSAGVFLIVKIHKS